MKLKLLFLCMGLINSTAITANCTLPCGPQELLDCAAARQPIPLASGEELYNQTLFQQGDGETLPMLDGFCQQPFANLPAGSLSTGLQQYYYYENQGNYCQNTNPENPYYSYAQETNGGAADPVKKTCIAPCRGGFYWRYENSWLLGDDVNFQTVYYKGAGKDQFFVGASQLANTDISIQQTFTDNIWYSDSTDPTTDGVSIYTNSSTPMSVRSTMSQ